MKWSLKMTIILRILEKRLLATIVAWESFKRSGIYYFDDESVLLVETAFEKLQAQLQRIQDLENELSKDNPDGVSHASSSLNRGRKMNCFSPLIFLFFFLSSNNPS